MNVQSNQPSAGIPDWVKIAGSGTFCYTISKILFSSPDNHGLFLFCNSLAVLIPVAIGLGYIPQFRALTRSARHLIEGIVMILPLIVIFSRDDTPAPIALNIATRIGRYPPGTSVDGIIWKEDFSELRTIFRNQSGTDCESFNVLLQPWDRKVITAALVSNLPDVSLASEDSTPKVIEVRNPDGKVVDYPTQPPLSLMNVPYRLSIPKFHRYSEARVTWATNNAKIPANMREFLVRTSNHPTPPTAFDGVKREVERFEIIGDYVCFDRKYYLHEAITPQSQDLEKLLIQPNPAQRAPP